MDLLIAHVKNIFIFKMVTLSISCYATMVYFFSLISYCCLLTVTDVKKSSKHFLKMFHYYFQRTLSITLNLF